MTEGLAARQRQQMWEQMVNDGLFEDAAELTGQTNFDPARTVRPGFLEAIEIECEGVTDF